MTAITFFITPLLTHSTRRSHSMPPRISNLFGTPVAKHPRPLGKQLGTSLATFHIGPLQPQFRRCSTLLYLGCRGTRGSTHVESDNICRLRYRRNSHAGSQRPSISSNHVHFPLTDQGAFVSPRSNAPRCGSYSVLKITAGRKIFAARSVAGIYPGFRLSTQDLRQIVLNHPAVNGLDGSFQPLHCYSIGIARPPRRGRGFLFHAFSTTSQRAA